MSHEARKNERGLENIPWPVTNVAGANGVGSAAIKKSWEVRQGMDVKNKILVAGASGLVGAAAIESFLVSKRADSDRCVCR